MAVARGRDLPLAGVARVIVIRRGGLCQHFLLRSDSRFLGVRLRATVARGCTCDAVQTARDDTCDDKGARSRYSRSAQDCGTAILAMFGVADDRRLILSRVYRRCNLVVQDLARHARRFARVRHPIGEVGFFASGVFVFHLFVFDGTVGPFKVFVLPSGLHRRD